MDGTYGKGKLDSWIFGCAIDIWLLADYTVPSSTNGVKGCSCIEVQDEAGPTRELKRCTVFGNPSKERTLEFSWIFTIRWGLNHPCQGFNSEGWQKKGALSPKHGASYQPDLVLLNWVRFPDLAVVPVSTAEERGPLDECHAGAEAEEHENIWWMVSLWTAEKMLI